jgi:hypothetical protein
VLSEEEQARKEPAMLKLGSIVPALTAFLIEQLQASQTGGFPIYRASTPRDNKKKLNNNIRA